MKIIVYDIELQEYGATPIELVQEIDDISDHKDIDNIVEDIVLQLVEEFETNTGMDVVFYDWKTE